MSNLIAPKIVTLTPIKSKVYKPLRFAIGGTGDAKYTQAGGGGSGGWQIVDRPKRVAATQWFDRSPWSLTLDLIMNNVITQTAPSQLSASFPATRVTSDLTGGNIQNIQDYNDALSYSAPDFVNIEGDCLTLESWLDAIPGTLTPPILSVSGPIPGTRHLYCLYSLEFQEALRHAKEGWRYQQNVNLVLYEYNPPTGKISNTAPSGHVDSYNYNNSSQQSSYLIATVSQGPNGLPIPLQSIANQYGVTMAAIQQVNGIRDPQNIVVGQTLLVPNSNG
jgi:hypothetical protein